VTIEGTFELTGNFKLILSHLALILMEIVSPKDSKFDSLFDGI
jgi:hypothetical protein